LKNVIPWHFEIELNYAGSFTLEQKNLMMQNYFILTTVTKNPTNFVAHLGLPTILPNLKEYKAALINVNKAELSPENLEHQYL
jgi:hypothetical protein